MQREITRKNAKGNYLKKIKQIFLNFQQVIYSISSISCPSLKLLAVIVFEIPSFLCPNFQRAITKNNNFFFKFSPGYLLIILYLLTKFEAPSCYTFWDILITKLNSQRAITCKNAKGNNSKKIKYFFLNFHQVIYSVSSISCPSLKLLAAIVFEISSFLCPNFQRAITQK